MDENENSVIAEAEIAEQPIPETQTDAVAAEQAHSEQESVQQKQRNTRDENMAKMRESLEQLRRQNLELQNAVMQTHQVRQSAPPAPEPDELATLPDDDFVSVAQMKKFAARVAQETVQSALKQQKGASLEDRFRAAHPDYDEVVNKENLETLFQEMPELRGVLTKAYESAMKGDDVDPVSLSYKLIKKYSTTLGESSMSKKTPEILARNAQKPVSSNAIKSAALSEAHKYAMKPTKEEADRLYKETVEAARARR